LQGLSIKEVCYIVRERSNFQLIGQGVDQVLTIGLTGYEHNAAAEVERE
jgi:hypothetical protein